MQEIAQSYGQKQQEGEKGRSRKGELQLVATNNKTIRAYQLSKGKAMTKRRQSNLLVESDISPRALLSGSGVAT